MTIKGTKNKKKTGVMRRSIALGDTALGSVSEVVSVPIMGPFSVSVNGLVVDGNPKIEVAEVMGLTLRTAERGIQFAIGDFINWAEDAYGEEAAQIIDYSDGWNEKTCNVYRWVAKRIARNDRRMDRLGIKHHIIVAALAPQSQRKWLTAASADDEEQAWTVAKLKKEMEESGEDLPVTFWVIVSCVDVPDQTALMSSLTSQGRSCKAQERKGKAMKAEPTTPEE